MVKVSRDAGGGWRQGITRNVFVLGCVSLLTDISSEMIYPLLPVFLTTVLGAGPAFLGVIEGVAESTAALLKLASGLWADRVRDRSRLVLGGYTLSSLARPLIATATQPWQALVVRFSDRAGKGIRTSPRDAIIADAVSPSLRGRAFGFQRSMDHAGAVIGPLTATALLTAHVVGLRGLFWLAGIPGLLAVALVVVGVREAAATRATAQGRLRLAPPRGRLRAYLWILLLFTLGNSADAFLLLRAGQLGVPTPALPLLWMTLHVVKMGSTWPLGALSDRLGRRRVIIAGWMIFAAVYAGLAVATAAWHVWALIALYGLFFGLTEGAERALLADLASAAERGGAFGWYHAVVGVGALPASLLFGALWQVWGAPAAFGAGAALAMVSAVLLGVCVR